MINTFEFWAVLTGSLAIYWLIPFRLRLGFLAASSFAYLFTLDAFSLVGLLPIALAFYLLAPRTSKGDRTANWLLAGLVFGMLGYLYWFKYVPPLLAAFATSPQSEQLLLPLGISYFTFKLIHYAIETSRGNVQNPSLATFWCYVMLFPTFTAGPIERFDHFVANREQHLTRDAAAWGLQRILFGMIKKFAIVEALIVPALAHPSGGEIAANLESYSFLRVWLHCLLFFAYAYLDFSSYSDIAIGASRLFGLQIMENFNFPFLARNINEFWNRWHMTLSGWCRAYVYMPTIGITRNPYLAVYATMAAIGLWHAGTLNWLFWGLYHATGIALYGAWSRLRRRRRLPPGNSLPRRALGTLITVGFVTGSYAFPVAHEHGNLILGLRMLLKLMAINILPGAGLDP